MYFEIVESLKVLIPDFTSLLLVTVVTWSSRGSAGDRCEHLREEAELSAGVGLALEPHERGDDVDPRGDGMFCRRALTIWADLSQVRGSQAVIATVILGQAWGAHHRGRVGVSLTSQT